MRRLQIRQIWLPLIAATLAACEAPPTARVELVLPARDADGRALLPWAEQPVFHVRVEAPDLEAPLAVTGLPGQVVSLEVPPGTARTLKAQLFAAAEITLPSHEGEAGPFDLAADERRAVTVDLWRLPVPVDTPLPFVQLSAGEAITCGITVEGTGWCWGWNAEGAISSAVAEVTVTMPTRIEVDEPVRAIDVGAAEVCAVGADTGKVYCFGQTAEDLASGVREIQGLPGPAVDVAVGYSRSCAVAEAGSVHCWGEIIEGCVECAPAVSSFPMTGITTARTVESAASTNLGEGQTFCALLTGGSVKCWGANQDGQAGEPDTFTYPIVTTPVAVALPAPAVEIGVGTRHSCARLNNGTVWCWGDGWNYQIGNGAYGTYTQPTQVSLSQAASRLAVGVRSSCASYANGSVVCWGAGLPPYDNTGYGSTNTVPTSVNDLAGFTPTVGAEYLCGLDPAGQARCLGYGREGQTGDQPFRTRSTPVQVGSATGWTQVSTVQSSYTASTSCAIRNGRLFCWGANYDGQLGVGLDPFSFGYTATPLEVGGTDWAEVDHGSYLVCGRKTTGTVWCWGYASYQGTLTAPAQAGTVNTLVDIDVNGQAACAAGSDGLYCWGDINYFPPGFVNMGTPSTPQQVTTTTFTQVAMGYYFACGIRPDTSLLCWGNNDYGRLGIGSALWTTYAPTSVGGTGWAQVVADDYRVCARKSAGQVYCWGDNWYRTMGLPASAPDEVSVPTQVSGLTGSVATDISLSAIGLCATLSNGTSRCVGKPFDYGPPYAPYMGGFLGIGNAVSATTLTDGPAGPWTDLSFGSDRVSCGIRSDGTLWCWGDPYEGSLGIGTPDYNSPIWISQPIGQVVE